MLHIYTYPFSCSFGLMETVGEVGGCPGGKGEGGGLDCVGQPAGTEDRAVGNGTPNGHQGASAGITTTDMSPSYLVIQQFATESGPSIDFIDDLFVMIYLLYKTGPHLFPCTGIIRNDFLQERIIHFPFSGLGIAEYHVTCVMLGNGRSVMKGRRYSQKLTWEWDPNWTET